MKHNNKETKGYSPKRLNILRIIHGILSLINILYLWGFVFTYIFAVFVSPEFLNSMRELQGSDKNESLKAKQFLEHHLFALWIMFWIAIGLRVLLVVSIFNLKRELMRYDKLLMHQSNTFNKQLKLHSLNNYLTMCNYKLLLNCTVWNKLKEIL